MAPRNCPGARPVQLLLASHGQRRDEGGWHRTSVLSAAVLLCLVIAVTDGDTLKVRCPDQPQLVVRLAEIDAPEKRQPFGQRAKQALSDLCYRQQAEIRPTARDRYGRTVARVSCAGTDASAAQARAGFAWAYTRYLTDPQIAGMERMAQRERAGLWADERPVPPWEWRRPSSTKR